MEHKPKNGSVKLAAGDMDYIRFGAGKQSLVMLPGLGDGLRSVRGTAVPMALVYRAFAKEFTVYAFSRKTVLPPGYTTQDMAQDQAEAMDRLGIRQAAVIGISMGGMIAQFLAAEFPERISKLVLVVTAARPNPILAGSVREWVCHARAGNHAALLESNLRRIYSEGYYQKNKWLVPVIAKLTEPESYGRFFVQAEACASHDASHQLRKIRAPVLVIGGEQDNTLGGDASYQLAREIPGAKLRMYPQWGHGLYEEAKDFNQVVLDFLRT